MQSLLADLWRAAGHRRGRAGCGLLSPARNRCLPSSFAVGTAAQATVAAAAAGRQRTVAAADRPAAARQRRHARTPASSSAASATADRRQAAAEHRDKIVGLYRSGDGRWVRLHTNLPHHRAGTLKLLGADYDRAAVQRALDGWEASSLEDAAAEAGLVVTATRSFAEWDAHPQGRAVARPAAVHHRTDRRCAAAAAAARRPSAGRHQGAGPDARDRRARCAGARWRRMAPTCC